MRPLFDPFAASSRPYPPNTAIHKAEIAKQLQNQSTNPFAPGASDTRTISRRFDTGWTRNGHSARFKPALPIAHYIA